MEVKNIVLLVVFILLIVIIQFARGHSVDEIINKYIEARGGKEKLNSIQSLCMKGVRQMMGNNIPVRVTIVQGKLFRTDFEYVGKPGYLIVTEKEGWSYIPMQSQTVKQITPDALEKMQVGMDIPGPLVNYAAKGYKAELEGKEIVEGKEAHKIKLISHDGNTVTYFIDTVTNFLVQIKHIRADVNGNEKEVITNFSNYRPVDGIMFPHTIINPGEGVMAGITTFDTIIINQAIDESQYKP